MQQSDLLPMDEFVLDGDLADFLPASEQGEPLITTVIHTPIRADASLSGFGGDVIRPALTPLPVPTADAFPTIPMLAALPAPTLRACNARQQALRRFSRILFLVLYDAACITLAFYIAYFLRFAALRGVTFVGSTSFVSASLADLTAYQFALVASMLSILAVRGMYRWRATEALLQQASLLFVASTACFAAFSVYDFFFRATQYELVKDTRAIVVFTWLAAMMIPFGGRLVLAVGMHIAYRLGFARTRLLVIGSGQTGKIVLQHLAALPGLGFQVMGFIHEKPQDAPGDFGRFKMLGTLDACERVIRAYRIGEVVIALPNAQHAQIAAAIEICEQNGVLFRLVPDIHDLSLTRVHLEAVQGMPMLSVRRAAAGWKHGLKRLSDLIIAALVLVIGLPLWLALALLIRVDSPGPIIYRQTRVGLRGRTFTSYKFRSMHVDADAHRADLQAENMAGRGLFKLKHDPRCTRIGRWLRRMSLDEIPQLWNVMRGEMALVGPRPPLPEEVARYQEWEKRRLDIAPGLTGLWQVRGRSDISFDEMVLMDLYYLENWSLSLDCEILLKTLPVVIFRRGAY
jgi:exopolysaccharide biosynthesis polyprenyl glycosylphosphotransferase